MAGNRQHFIPRFLLKGFRIPSKKKPVLVFRYGKDQPVVSTRIENVAVGKHFYSNPSSDDPNSLDDSITDYEQDIARLVEKIRNTSPHDPLDSVEIGTVLGHLTFRNAHIRDTFSGAMEILGEQLNALFSNPENLIAILGLERGTPSDLMAESFEHILDHHPELQHLNLPPELFSRIMLQMLRENLDQIDFTDMSYVQELCAKLVQSAPDIVKSGHKEALLQDTTAGVWADRFAKLVWRKITLDTDLILPDCVAAAELTDGNFLPAAYADVDKTRRVLFPIASHQLLIGEMQATADTPSAEKTNEVFAACSDRFFVCAEKSDHYETLQNHIGRQSATVLQEAIFEAIAEFPERWNPRLDPEDHPAITPPDNDAVPHVGQEEFTRATTTIPVSFRGDVPKALVDMATGPLTELIGQISSQLSLRRLDGITVGADYLGIIEELTGQPQGNRTPNGARDDGCFGVLKTLTVQQEDECVYHIVCHSNLLALLADNKASEHDVARYLVGVEVASAGVFHGIDIAAPGLLSAPQASPSMNWLFGCVYHAIEKYLAIFIFSQFGKIPTEYCEEILVLAVRQYNVKIPELRLSYRHHGDLEQLLNEVRPLVEAVLSQSASFAAIQAITSGEYLMSDELQQSLDDGKIGRWIVDFSDHLESLLKNSDSWRDQSTFLKFRRHTERLLWQHSIFMFDTVDGHCRVEIPRHVDAAAMAAH